MRIQVISKDNGVGLTHDFRVLKEAILLADPSAEVLFTDWRQPRRGERFDINFHLELVGKDHMAQAPRNIYVPNPEWYYANLWDRLMPRMTEVWAKTRDCESIFKSKHHRVEFSGWTSDDTHRPVAEKLMQCLHVAGASSAKGTLQVIEAASMLPDIAFVLVSRTDRFAGLPTNVRLVISPSSIELLQLQNTSMVHLCPSSYEGFGHYINEARACGAFVITTNAPPMNELIDKMCGAAVAAPTFTTQNLAVHHHVTGAELAGCIESVMGANMDILQRYGANARKAYVDGRASFHTFVTNKIHS